MKVDVLKLEDRYAELTLEDVDPNFANALRRTLVADIPKMAIEDVEFHLGPIRGEEGEESESVTPLFDEVIAHRLGLIPIPTDLELFTFRDQCKDCASEGCPNCTIMYSLNKKGPCTVYSGDLEPVGDSSLKVVDEKIPIVKLGGGQAMLVYATAILGTGKDHAKWQVAQGVGYKYFPVIEVDGDKCDFCGVCAEVCPRDVFSVKKKKVEVKSPLDCNFCMTCVEECPKKCVSVEGDPTKIHFHFETDGSLKAADALRFALNSLAEKFESLGKKVYSLK
ncbi:MAG: DNA-directed RNA polymerase subunit D [Thermoplasmata archaeon]|nr:DNA-directed RNA polymerase subunit D [Candidatus Thermoplasmatota archaeon]MCK4949533.1 DNA-directed RNA polymerase subunit D [Thermoplasmata archaeon]